MQVYIELFYFKDSSPLAYRSCVININRVMRMGDVRSPKEIDYQPLRRRRRRKPERPL